MEIIVIKHSILSNYTSDMFIVGNYKKTDKKRRREKSKHLYKVI